jgi:predicted DNA-binding transcriptional regulator YafY
MPSNKHFEIRKKKLNELFRTKAYTLEELLKIVGNEIRDHRQDGAGVSKKTIQNDIKAMREEAEALGGAIVCTEGRYRYKPKDFNIYDISIDPYDIERIKLAAQLIQEIPGLKFYDELKETIDRLEMRSSSVMTGPDRVYIQFDYKKDYSGSQHLNDLLEAIKGETVITFNYQPFKENAPSVKEVHPYLLKEYNHRWFLIGLNHAEQQIHVYGLERIKGKIKPAKGIEYSWPDSFNPKIYREDVVGVTLNDSDPETIRIKFARERADYVATNPIHRSQKVVDTTDSYTLFEYRLIPNKELIAIILSYGPDAEVIASVGLRKMIQEKAKALYQLYKK